MKLSLFIGYLWVLAFSQIIYANHQDQDTQANKPVIQESVQVQYTENEKTISAHLEKAFCRFDVSEEKSFPENTEIVKNEANCDTSYYDNQVRISEAREHHEYIVWSTLAPPEPTLAQSTYSY